MRLGRRTTHFVSNNSILSKYSLLRKNKILITNFIELLYGNKDSIEERHRHRYEVNPKYIEEFEKAGMKFTGRSDDNERMEIFELENHPYFVGVQFHPEYISRPLRPSAPYLGLIWVKKFLYKFLVYIYYYFRLLSVN